MFKSGGYWLEKNKETLIGSKSNLSVHYNDTTCAGSSEYFLNSVANTGLKLIFVSMQLKENRISFFFLKENEFCAV